MQEAEYSHYSRSVVAEVAPSQILSRVLESLNERLSGLEDVPVVEISRYLAGVEGVQRTLTSLPYTFDVEFD